MSATTWWGRRARRLQWSIMATTSVRVVKEHIGRPRRWLVNCWTGCVWFIDISHSSKTIRVRCVQPKRRRPPPLKASSGRCTAERTSTNMYATGIDLSEMKRVQIIEQCNACLADAVDLQLHCKHAHWNVKGPNFIALHQLFDQVNESVED